MPIQTPPQLDNPAQSQRTVSKLIVVGILTFILGFACNALGTKVYFGSPHSGSVAAVDLTTFRQVESLLKQKFDGKIDTAKQSEGAVAGMVAALGDPYTTYLTAAANKALSDDLNGQLSGIGVEVGIKNSKLAVIAPIDGTPAAKAGLRSGDIIAAIDGVDSSGLSLDEAVTKIRGTKGTKVKLAIIRGTEQPKELEIVRDNITVASAITEVREGNIGYIKIRRFSEDTNDIINNAVASFKDAGVKGIMLDLRDNPGGYLETAVSVSSQFMKTGVVVEERSKFNDGKKLYAASGGNFTDLPVVVLINGGSASASEITAGALHDSGRATLVGEKSFGKGSVQQIIDLKGGASLKVTVAHWYTPKGINIGKAGIKPDVEVKLTADDYNASLDPQYAKALEVLKAKL